jgi:glutathione S-transferase
MIKLYHGTTSVCAIKVRLVLAEKGLDWEGEILNLQQGDQHTPEYLKLNPNGVIPTLVHDGNVIIESSVILGYLDEAFPDPSLMPADPVLRARVRLWMKRVDDVLHAAIGVVTFATANRKVLIRKSPEDLAAHFARIPDPAYRERQRQSVEMGLAAPLVETAVRQYDKAATQMEADLADTEFPAGDAWSLADAALTPYINRAEMLGMEGLWAVRPNIARWFAAMKARPTYGPCIEDVLSDADRDRFDVPRGETDARLREILAA